MLWHFRCLHRWTHWHIYKTGFAGALNKIFQFLFHWPHDFRIPYKGNMTPNAHLKQPIHVICIKSITRWEWKWKWKWNEKKKNTEKTRRMWKWIKLHGTATHWSLNQSSWNKIKKAIKTSICVNSKWCAEMQLKQEIVAYRYTYI